jgi:hypothetical protein
MTQEQNDKAVDEFVFGGDLEDIPPGTYAATVTSILVKHSEKMGNDFLAWDFTLTDSGSIVGGSSSVAKGQKGKTYRWTKAIVGGDPVSLREAIGRPCLVVVEESDSGWPKVTSVLPPMVAGAKTDIPAGDVPF